MKDFWRRAGRAASRSSGRARRGPMAMAVTASVLASLAFSATALADTVTTGTDLPNQVPYGYKAPANDGLGVSREDQARLGDRAGEQGLQRELHSARGHAVSYLSSCPRRARC